jgi:hypothetical protein
VINDFEEMNKMQSNAENNSDEPAKNIKTWINGPAAYWYEKIDVGALLEAKRKEIRNRNKKKPKSKSRVRREKAIYLGR